MTTDAEPGWVLVPPLSAAAAAAVLRAPWLPPFAVDALPLAIAAAAPRLSVGLAVPTAWRLRVARALHALAASTTPLYRSIGPLVVASPPPPGATVLIDPETLDAAERTILACWLDDAAAWILLGASGGPATMTVSVPPLAERRTELPVLAAAVLAAVAGRAGRPAPALADDACTRLAMHPWPGDLPALEMVLGRASLAARDGIIRAADLDLDAPSTAPAAIAVSPPPATFASPLIAAVQLERLLAEMGHELRNPLTVLSPFTQVPEVLADPAERAHFAKVGGEALGRMRDLLDNVVEFGRFGPPAPQTVDVVPLLDAVLDEARAGLAARAVTLERTGTESAPCTADPEQLHYALRNLVAGVAHALPAREALRVDTSANGVVRLRFTPTAGSDGFDALATDLGGRLTDPSVLPLSLSLARAMLVRSGGSLEVHAEPGGATTVVVRLPVATAA